MGKNKITIDTNNLISALGWEGKVDYIISGDNHLLQIKQFRNVKNHRSIDRWHALHSHPT